MKGADMTVKEKNILDEIHNSRDILDKSRDILDKIHNSRELAAEKRYKKDTLEIQQRTFNAQWVIISILVLTLAFSTLIYAASDYKSYKYHLKMHEYYLIGAFKPGKRITDQNYANEKWNHHLNKLESTFSGMILE
jgi:hypothetical protein